MNRLATLSSFVPKRPQLSRSLLLGSVLLAACMQSVPGVSDARPDWLSAEPARYPNAQYVTATGSAGDAERARDRALANLAKVFELRIRETATTLQEVQSRKQGGEENVVSTQRLRRDIQTDTDKIIQGARIAEQWLDRADFTHYALAVLDRRQAGNNLRAEIEQRDADTRRLLDQLQSATAVEQVSRLNRALQLQQQRAALQQTLRIIDLGGQGMAPLWSEVALRGQLQQALQNMRISLVVKPDNDRDLASLVKGAMGRAGFAAQNRNPAYVLTATLDTQPVFESQGWYWLRGSFLLQLSDTGGQVLGQRSWPLKISSVQAALLRPRLHERLESILNTELQAAVLELASGDK